MSVLRDALRDLPDAAFFDLLESEAAYLLVLDVPGVPEDRLDVAVEDGCITIEARRRKEQPDAFDYVEENRPLFHDVELPMPRDAVPAEAELSVDRGVLELRLPKRSGGAETSIDVVETTEGSDAESPAEPNGDAVAASDPGGADGSEADDATRIDVDETGGSDTHGMDETGGSDTHGMDETGGSDADGSGTDDAFEADESS